LGKDQERELVEAEALLRDFYDGWSAAAAMYATYPEAAVAEHNDTTAANCMRCHMFAEVVRRFDGRRGCTLKDIRGLKVLLWQDRQVWRFKKLDRFGRHSNYQTSQQEDFDDQWPLEGIPERASRLTSGYMLDPSGSTIERIAVSRVLGRNVIWVAQTVLLEDGLEVRDITPARIPGTDRTDFDPVRARQRRRRR
jgi:hypothetical protein